jgi:peptidoglycan hydrolase-like protein with peptidoglycan-binding domain
MKSSNGKFGTFYYSDSAFTKDNQKEKEANALYIYKSMSSDGWTLNAICGILGNIQVESALNPARWQSGKVKDSSGYGLVQWTPSTNYLSWAGENNKDELMVGQLARIKWEHDNGKQFFAVKDLSKANYNDGLNYNITFKQFVISNQSAYVLGRIFGRCYERSGAILNGTKEDATAEDKNNAEKSLNTRGVYAEEWFDYLTKLLNINPVIESKTNDVEGENDVLNDFTNWNCKVNTREEEGLSLWSTTEKSTRTRIIRVKKGETIYIKEDKNNGWGIAEYSGEAGYVDLQYLVKINEKEITEEVTEESIEEVKEETIEEIEEITEDNSFVPIIAMQTKSKCYVRGRSIVSKGILVHSTGCVNRNIKRYVEAVDILGKNEYNNHWNKSDATKAMHGWVGYDKDKNVIALQALPYDIACWGCGGGTNGSYNYDATSSKPKQKSHLQFEICEGSSTDSEYYKKAIEVAEDYCVYLCKRFGFTTNNITTHKEAAEAGFASNHGDPQSYMKKFGDDITSFRNRIAKKLGNAVVDVNNSQTESSIFYSTLKIGSNNEDVKILQNFLNQCGYNLEIDSAFGSLTEKTVKEYQEKNGLTIDGIVGENTWNCLYNEVNNT